MFYKDKKVLVTGGSGFIGTHIVQELLKHGAKIRVPIYDTPLNIKDENIETINANLMNMEDCVRAVKGIDYVFHAAGVVVAAGATTSDLMSAIRINLVLTVNMLQAAWEQNVERFLVFTGSTTYPLADHPVKEEEMWLGPTHPSYFGYGWMRRYLERVSEFVASKSNMKIAIVRPTAVYGKWDNFDPSTSHVIPALIRKAVDRINPYEVWGTGDEVRDFLYAEDLARGCLLMLEKYAEADPVNIGYGNGATIREVVELVLKAAGYNNAKIVFNSSKPSTIPIRSVDTLKAERLLGFKPSLSLEEGINDTVKWYIKKYHGQKN